MPPSNQVDRPRTVLYLIRTWAFGGSHTIVLRLLKHIPTDRYRVICVPYQAFTNGDDAFVGEARKQGLTVADERIPWQSRRSWSRARRTVADLIEKYNVDLIHTHDPHSNVLVGLGRRRWPCACVASAYGWWSAWFPVRRCVYIWLERSFALPQFDRVLTVSEHMKGKILKGPTLEKRIRVVNTGLDLRALEPTKTRAEVRLQLGIPDNGFVVGTVSRVSPEKGHKYLLQAAASLLKTFRNLHILIVGTGPARPELERLAQRLGVANRVTFTGFYDSVPNALQAMDVMVQPSILEEGFPTSVLEAQAAGVPVIASDIGGTSETLNVPETGLLAAPRNPDSLADALERVLSDGSLREEMGRAAREFVTRSFALERMIGSVCTAYDEALEAYRRQQ